MPPCGIDCIGADVLDVDGDDIHADAAYNPVVLQEYQVIGHRLPTGSDPTPKAGGCASLPPNEAIAKSRF